jgi:hypothetical protein
MFEALALSLLALAAHGALRSAPPGPPAAPSAARGPSAAPVSVELVLNGDFENGGATGCHSNLSNSAFDALMANCFAFGSANEIDVYVSPPCARRWSPAAATR